MKAGGTALKNMMMWKVLLTKKHLTVNELHGEPKARLHRKLEESQANMEKRGKEIAKDSI